MMMTLGPCLYGMCCGLSYLLVSVFLGVTLVFLFVTFVSAVSEAVEHYLDGEDGGLTAASRGF